MKPRSGFSFGVLGMQSISFITREQETLEILKEHASPILHLQSNEEVEMLYEERAHSLERKPYPAIEAITNFFRLAMRRNPEIASFNPLALWNSHYVRELDDSGYNRSTLPIKKGEVKNPAFFVYVTRTFYA